MFVKKTVFFNNLFFKFNRDLYKKSTNSCILFADIIIYNLNIITTFSTTFYQTKRNRREHVHCCAAHPLTGTTLKI